MAVTVAAPNVGCQMRVAATPPETLQAEPLATDPAMLVRDWPVQNAVYHNTSIVAGPTGFLFEPKRDQAAWQYSFLDTGVFLVNVVAMPVAFVMTPPWAPVAYRSETVESTYSAMPPLPPEQQQPSQQTDVPAVEPTDVPPSEQPTEPMPAPAPPPPPVEPTDQPG